ncbi:unnamed protein product [Amoebophrya sp. A120]|nr:unnamed protein product [Amoebophrya sp. A120]|eukprot:GSA120T00008387001.1
MQETAAPLWGEAARLRAAIRCQARALAVGMMTRRRARPAGCVLRLLPAPAGPCLAPAFCLLGLLLFLGDVVKFYIVNDTRHETSRAPPL